MFFGIFMYVVCVCVQKVPKGRSSAVWSIRILQQQ